MSAPAAGLRVVADAAPRSRHRPVDLRKSVDRATTAMLARDYPQVNLQQGLSLQVDLASLGSNAAAAPTIGLGAQNLQSSTVTRHLRTMQFW